MEKDKKSGLYFFESYEEIRNYVAQGFPTSVGLEQNENHYGGYVGDDGKVLCHAGSELGALEDFPVKEFYTYHNFEAVAIKAATMLEGLYKAGELLAAQLVTHEEERRTLFTASEILKPLNKGGLMLDYPKEPEPLYMITVQECRYTVAASSVFMTIDGAERVEGVAAAKRHRFTIRNKAAQCEVLARCSFEVDKVLPKMKGMWDKGGVRPVMCQPAIDLQEGAIVSTDGRILALHKLHGFERGEMKKELPWDVVSVPREVLGMKGTVTVEVQVAERTGKDIRELRICATDAKRAYAEVTQKGHYPNYMSVFPAEVGPAIVIDAAAFTKAVKQVAPSVNTASQMMVLSAARGAAAITLSGKDVDYSMDASVVMPVEGGVPGGVRMGAKVPLTLKALMFNPTKVLFTDPGRAVLFDAADTIVLMMPMYLERWPEKADVPEKSDLREFSVGKWMKRCPSPDPSPIRAGRKLKAAKVAAPQPSHISHQPSVPQPSAPQPTFAELLRKVLLAA